MVVGSLGLLSLFVVLLSGLLLGCLLLTSLGGSKSFEVQRVWEIYDDRLQYMSEEDASLLDRSIDSGNVSLAWSVWSRAAESALVDAFRSSGGPVPFAGLILGRGSALLRSVQIGGPRVRRARSNAADAVDVADVFFVS